MKWDTNDLLYAFMRCLSTAKPEEGKYREYLPIKHYKQNKKAIAAICGCSTKTIDRHLDKLCEKGLVDQGVEIIEVNGKEYEYECYWFPYNETGVYKIVDKDVVSYLVNTRNPQAIRIYLYLLNKYQWKKDYVFTIGEIKEVLGYSKTTKTCDDLIKHVLASFKAEGIINYEKIIEEKDIGGLNNSKVVPVQRIKLVKVIANKEDLPKF